MPIVLLDSEPLGLISNPGNKKRPRECRNKIKHLIKSGILVVVPEIIDYELRRELLLSAPQSVENLDKLEDLGLVYAPLSTEVMRKASQLWAWARKTGQSTAHEKKIDIDVILVAQSIVLSSETGEYIIIATADINDLRRYNIDAMKWDDITVDYCFNPKPSKIKLRKP